MNDKIADLIYVNKTDRKKITRRKNYFYSKKISLKKRTKKNHEKMTYIFFMVVIVKLTAPLCTKREQSD